MDEAYFEYADAPDYPNSLALRHLRERLLVMRTFSKIYGLAGLRIGYGVAARVGRDRRRQGATRVRRLARRAGSRDSEHRRLRRSSPGAVR